MIKILGFFVGLILLASLSSLPAHAIGHPGRGRVRALAEAIEMKMVIFTAKRAHCTWWEGTGRKERARHREQARGRRQNAGLDQD